MEIKGGLNVFLQDGETLTKPYFKIFTKPDIKFIPTLQLYISVKEYIILSNNPQVFDVIAFPIPSHLFNVSKTLRNYHFGDNKNRSV